MITVHHLNNSRSQRILWLLEELNLPYEVKRYERDKKTMLAPPELKKVHPLGKSPVITDGNLTIAESGAIIQYLINKYDQGKLRPETEEGQLSMLYWLHYSEGSIMPPLLLSLIMNKIETAPMPFFAKPIAKEIVSNVKKAFLGPQLETHLQFMEDELTKHTWFAGSEFSAADIMMSFAVEAAKARGHLTKHPKLIAYLERIHAMPGYKKAIETGGEYDYR